MSDDGERAGWAAIVFSFGFAALVVHVAGAAWLYTQPGAVRGILPYDALYKPTWLLLDWWREGHGMNVAEQRLFFTIAGGVQFLLFGIAIDMVYRAFKMFW